MPDALVVSDPPEGGPGRQLVLLFHGVGSDAPALVPLGRLLAQALPRTTVLSVPGPFDSDLGRGRQWFSVVGVTEDNRPGRIDAVMPRFIQTVQDLQQRHGVAPAGTVLAGFSQGAILALESARAGHVLAGRIVALAGRFAQPPESVPAAVAFHLLHGEQDPVVPAAYAVQGAQALRRLGAPVTLDLFPATGHELTAPMASALVGRLQAPAGRDMA